MILWMVSCGALLLGLVFTWRGYRARWHVPTWIANYRAAIKTQRTQQSEWPDQSGATGDARDVFVVSPSPRLLVCPKFLSDEECDRLLGLASASMKLHDSDVRMASTILDAKNPGTMSAEDVAFVEMIEERIAALTGIPAHKGEEGLVVYFNPPVEASAPRDERRLHLGLHLDTNKGCSERCCTVVMYLNDVLKGKGGETVFPCIGADDIVADCGKVLHSFSFTHTQNCGEGHKFPAGVLMDAGNRLCGHPGPNSKQGGLCVRPEKGLAVLFYTRGANGDIDPGTWHGGAAVEPGGVGKWSVQKFKAIPLEQRRSREAMHAYAGEHFSSPEGSPFNERPIGTTSTRQRK